MVISKEQITHLLDNMNIPYNGNSNPPEGIKFIITTSGQIKISIFVPLVREERVIFQFQLNFGEAHQKALNKMVKGKFNHTMQEWTDKLTTYGANWQFVMLNDQQVSQIRITKFIEEDGFSNDRFYTTFERIEIVGSQMIRVIQMSFGSEENKFTNKTNDPSFIG